MTSVSERTSTGSYVTVNSVASSSSAFSSSDGAAALQSSLPDASDAKKQPLTEAERRRRRGPNYKPLDELRLFGKVMSTAIQSVIADGIKSKLPHYFRKGNAFAVANGAHRFSFNCLSWTRLFCSLPHAHNYQGNCRTGNLRNHTSRHV